MAARARRVSVRALPGGGQVGGGVSRFGGSEGGGGSPEDFDSGGLEARGGSEAQDKERGEGVGRSRSEGVVGGGGGSKAEKLVKSWGGAGGGGKGGLPIGYSFKGPAKGSEMNPCVQGDLEPWVSELYGASGRRYKHGP
jgi:hypothetical protein